MHICDVHFRLREVESARSSSASKIQTASNLSIVFETQHYDNTQCYNEISRVEHMPFLTEPLFQTEL